PTQPSESVAAASEPASRARPEPARAVAPGAAQVVAVAVPEQAGGAPPLELDGLRAVWPAVLDTLKDSNALCAALLADAQPVAVDGEQVTVAFPATASFLRRKAEDETYRSCVAAAVRTITGSRARIAYVLGQAPVDGDEPAAAPPAEPTDEEWVARLVAEFDAEEIHSDPQPDPSS
ncbi:MAG: hypothetical protein M3401_15440, partial [Actinomycetota bacterium]|nr:hypothetical protein [Actinomycetota bacterium]